VPKALDRLERQLAMIGGDWRAAVAVLQLAGLDRRAGDRPDLGSGIGPTDPLAVVDAAVRERRRRQSGDELGDLLEGGPISDHERLAVLQSGPADALALAVGREPREE
jgi:hypothetical protein